MTADLSAFVESVSPETHLRVEQELGDGFVLLRRDEAERRQAAQDIRCSEDAVIEMLRNARDAGATRIYVATGLEQNLRHLTILDNGSGIPERMHERIFDPRVTSKLDSVHMDKWGIHGRGMALYSIATNSKEARVTASELGLGASLVTVSDITALPEKSDQSSFPRFVLDERGAVKISGPKNILRTCCEFALEHRGQIDVFVGSASEIAATLMEAGSAKYSMAELTLKRDLGATPVVDRLAFSQSPDHFAAIAKELGLAISSRTARRIMDGEIEPLEPLTERIRVNIEAPSAVGKTMKARKKKGLTLKLQRNDIAELSQGVSEAFSTIAQRYYLQNSAQPTVKIRGGEVHISIPLIPLDD